MSSGIVLRSSTRTSSPSSKEISTLSTPSHQSTSSSEAAIRAIALSSLASTTNVAPTRRRGIPEYIGGDSLRSVFTIDTCSTSAALTGGMSTDDGSSIQEDQERQEHLQHEINRSAASSRTEESSCCGGVEHIHLSSPSNNWVWKVEASLVPVVPQDVPIERASLRIQELPLDTITARIADFLRINSISSYYPTEEPGRVDCLTSNCIKFVVQLWKDENDNSTIIVEVQRRRGCSIRMRSIRNCLYKCILSGEGPCRNCCEIHLRRPSRVLEQQICNELYANGNVEDEEQSKKRRNSNGQLFCVDLLESEKVDEKRLGIECFLGMTNPKNKSSHEVARALVYSEGSIAKRLRRAFLEFLYAKLPIVEGDAGCWSKNAFTRMATVTSSHDGVPTLQNTEVGDAHILALTALVNCLESVEAHERDYLANDTTKLKLGTPFWARVLQVLVYNLHEFSHQPLEAALSAKCLRILEKLEPERLSPFIDTSVAPLLKTAHEFGKDHHWSLEKESEELALRFCCNQDGGHIKRDVPPASSSF